jgi:hypothetical protein
MTDPGPLDDWQLWPGDLGVGDYGLRRIRDQRTAPGLLDGVDEQRDADFDDEERR